MYDYLRLMRPWQWYKNLLVFAPILFSGAFLDIYAIQMGFIAFMVLSLMSSSAYVINDMVDRDKDKKHPKKRLRSIAAGKVGMFGAGMLAFILFAVSSFWAYSISEHFLILVLALFISSFMYSVKFKDVAFLDVQFIAFNFVVRAVSGVVILDLEWSQWLLTVVYLLALFWALGKRHSEIIRLGDDSRKHRKVNAVYSGELLRAMSNIVCAMLLLSYVMYAFSSGRMSIIFTVPISISMVFRYLYFIHSGSEIAEKSERVFMDRKMVAGLVLWIAIIVLGVTLNV